MSLKDYILVIDDSIDANMCKFAIDAYEHNANLCESHAKSGMHFSQLNLSAHAQHDEQLASLQNYMVDASKFYIELYKSRVPDTDFWPKTYGFEEFRLKKYEPNGIDQFADHVDAANLITSKRFLVFFWYLNNVDAGGETEFLNKLDLKIKPKQGRLLMFPPLWTFPHRGCMPINESKYILGSYLHFV